VSVSVPFPVRKAATVMLLRDAADGLEVFMLRRNPKSVFVPGQFVFPGGAVDVSDSKESSLEDICVGLDDSKASQLMSIESGGLSYWVAAIRECFEEAGVLLARRDGDVMSFNEPETYEKFEGYRSQVYDGSLNLRDMCRQEGLHLDLNDLRYVSHWITPIGPPKRFDTRFFLARSPEGQEPLHDGGETVESCWITPADAQRLHSEGKFEMIMPTVANLEPLLTCSSVDEAMAWAESLSEIPAILPAIATTENGTEVYMPGEAGYEKALANPPGEGSTQ
jgi:8-oxo-dGTP pyrophosphatase MutT (NUDIX family)|tara:strand:+ start:1819 stop:2655 length:837 start_codon:yes stop_codon:yes gene_type:complete